MSDSTAGTTSYDAVLQPVTEETRCQYTSKRCEFHRTVKRNGKLHRFCDYHRMKANLNQRRVDRKRRMEQEGNQTSKEGSVSVSPTKQLQSDAAWYEDLDPKDLEYLDHLLSSGEAEKILNDADEIMEQYIDFPACAALYHQSH